MKQNICYEMNTWLNEHKFDIFGSLSFKNHFKDNIKQKSFQHFWNRADSHYFGSNRKKELKEFVYTLKKKKTNVSLLSSFYLIWSYT